MRLLVLIAAASLANLVDASPGKWTDMTVQNRPVTVFVPACADANTPIVLSLHAWATSKEMEQRVDRLSNYTSEANCAVIVYPQGKSRGELMGMVGWSWNAGGCCPMANTRKADDVEFLNDVIVEVAEKFGLNDQTIFVVGISNGGMMANRFACSNEKVKALVAVSGPLINGTGEPGFDSFECSRSVPMMHFHGTEDAVIPYDGCDPKDPSHGPMEMCKWMATMPGFPQLPWPTVQKTVDDWRVRNGLSADEKGSISFKNGTTSCMSWGTSANNVTFCSVGGEGHAWPGICSGKAATLPGMHCSLDIDASAHTLAFFKRYYPGKATVVV